MKAIYHLIAILLAVFALSFPAVASDTPPLPFYDYDACPFECCTYRTWTAVANTALLKDHIDSSSKVTIVNAGEEVQGITGVVITTKAGRVKIVKEIALTKENSQEEIKLKPGDIIYNLRYVGEGYDKFWLNGIFLVDQTSITKVGKSEFWEVIDLPEWVWWAKIKRQNGDVGWTRELNHFAHIDACE